MARITARRLITLAFLAAASTVPAGAQQAGGPREFTVTMDNMVFGRMPAGAKVGATQAWNKYFPGHIIAMVKPLSDGQVAYSDGSPQTVDQYARDVAAFLHWAAEPHLEARKRIGFQVMIFLIVFAGLMYFTKKKVWSQAKDHA